ncbi:hypothetical protein BaRGS_00039555 [Batillaria attramentaria]|uniref:Uncharacterized protein n=1 Tax=Batillaria attramentaria TaxID=370345 RepID=A0ABD0J2T0_9CAEN
MYLRARSITNADTQLANEPRSWATPVKTTPRTTWTTLIRKKKQLQPGQFPASCNSHPKNTPRTISTSQFPQNSIHPDPDNYHPGNSHLDNIYPIKSHRTTPIRTASSHPPALNNSHTDNSHPDNSHLDNIHLDNTHPDNSHLDKSQPNSSYQDNSGQMFFQFRRQTIFSLELINKIPTHMPAGHSQREGKTGFVIADTKYREP